MKPTSSRALTLNGGASSLRFGLYEFDDPPRKILAGKIDRIGLRGTNFVAEHLGEEAQTVRRITVGNHRAAMNVLLDWWEQQAGFAAIVAAGHRVVHGMTHSSPELITPRLLAELLRISLYDPETLPRAIELIEATRQRHPRRAQVACFDTAYHRAMPRVCPSRVAMPPRASSAMVFTACPVLACWRNSRASTPQPRRVA